MYVNIYIIIIIQKEEKNKPRKRFFGKVYHMYNYVQICKLVIVHIYYTVHTNMYILIIKGRKCNELQEYKNTRIYIAKRDFFSFLWKLPPPKKKKPLPFPFFFFSSSFLLFPP